MIMKIDPETYEKIYRNEYIQTGWKECTYEDFVNIIQCYKYWKLGHKANKCKYGNDVCPTCSGKHK